MVAIITMLYTSLLFDHYTIEACDKAKAPDNIIKYIELKDIIVRKVGPRLTSFKFFIITKIWLINAVKFKTC